MQRTTEGFENSVRHEIEERVGPRIDEAKQRLSQLNDDVTSFIRRRPGACLLGAVALGFIIGKLAQRA